MVNVGEQIGLTHEGAKLALEKIGRHHGHVFNRWLVGGSRNSQEILYCTSCPAELSLNLSRRTLTSMSDTFQRPCTNWLKIYRCEARYAHIRGFRGNADIIQVAVEGRNRREIRARALALAEGYLGRYLQSIILDGTTVWTEGHSWTPRSAIPS